jgi:hypothetical protein
MKLTTFTAISSIFVAAVSALPMIEQTLVTNPAVDTYLADAAKKAATGNNGAPKLPTWDFSGPEYHEVFRNLGLEHFLPKSQPQVVHGDQELIPVNRRIEWLKDAE